MENFTFYSPTCFVFGRDREQETGALIKKYGGTRVLVLYGGQSAERSGLLNRVRQSLQGSGLFFLELGGVKPNPRSGLVYQGIALCREQKVDFLLAVGGGSVIDSAKAIAAGVPYEGDFWDFHMGEPIVSALPVGTILTIAASGSEGSPDAVITNEVTGLKRGASADVLRPVFSVLNPELTQTLPPYQTACGAVDIMVHIFERYFTNTRDVELTDRLCEAVLRTMVVEVPKVMKNPGDYEARANIMWAGMLAHNNLLGVGREQDWASHLIARELSAVYDSTHGETLAVVCPAWMESVMGHNVRRFAQLAERVWGCRPEAGGERETAARGIRCFRAFLDEIGMPSDIRKLGVRECDFESLIKRTCWGEGLNGTIGRFVPLGEAEVREIYGFMKAKE